MAERAGFEPAVRCYPYDGLANRSFRPLRHLSCTIRIRTYYNLPYEKIKFVFQKNQLFLLFFESLRSEGRVPNPLTDRLGTEHIR